MELINIRSDTQTLPTAAMLEAMMTAPLGDDTYDEDPTVRSPGTKCCWISTRIFSSTKSAAWRTSPG
jgi:hypothetical protein